MVQPIKEVADLEVAASGKGEHAAGNARHAETDEGREKSSPCPQAIHRLLPASPV